MFPDFTVESYWSADNDDTPPDIVWVVIKVGVSLKEDNTNTLLSFYQQVRVGQQIDKYFGQLGAN
jgi:hypothetical protein